MFDTMMVAVGDAPGSDGVLALAARLAARCHAHGGVVLVDGMMATTVDEVDPIAFQWSRGKGDSPWLGAGSEITFEDRSRPLVILTRSAATITELAGRDLPGVPVLLLGRDLDDPSFVDRQPRILVVIDALDPDRALLGSAFSLSQATDGHLTLVTLVDPASSGRSPEEPSPALRLAPVQRRLDRLAAELREDGASVASLVVTSREPEMALVDLIERGRYDVTAIAGTPDGGHRLSPAVATLIRQVSKPLLIG